MEFFDVKKDGHVAIIIWHYGEQNQFTTPFLRANLETLAELEADASVCGVVVASSVEKYFSTGLHLAWMMEQGAKDPENVREFLELLHQILYTWAGFGKPLIAAIGGHSVGAGCILPACADYRLMTMERGFVRLPEVQINIPFWPGMSAILKDILPPASVRNMFLTGDKFTAAEAQALGYIDELCTADTLVPRAVALAAKLGAADPRTYRAIKHGMREGVLRIMRDDDPKAVEEFVKGLRAAH